MAGRCAKCGQAADISLDLQEILTLHIRGLGSQQRVQALGRIIRPGICSDCLDSYIRGILQPGRALLRDGMLYGGLAAAGVLMYVLRTPAGIGLSLKLPGAALVILGAAGFYRAVKDRLSRRDQAQTSSGEDNRARFVMEFMGTFLPRKAGDNDVTYVRLTPGLENERLGDLAVRHRLLPEIAGQLRSRAHSHFHRTTPSESRKACGTGRLRQLAFGTVSNMVTSSFVSNAYEHQNKEGKDGHQARRWLARWNQ